MKEPPVMTTSFKDFIARRNAAAAIAPVDAPAATSPLDRPLLVTFFANKFASSKTQETISLRGLVDRIKLTQAKTKDALPWLKLAAFGDARNEPKTPGAMGSLRHDANVLQIDGMEADYDGEKITVERARIILAGAGIAAVLYTSPSHTEDTPRWRVLCPTSVSLPATRRADLVARVNGLFVGALAGESFALSQSYYYGSVSGNPSHEVVVIEGQAIDLADELGAGAIGKQKPEPVARPVLQTATAPLTDGGTAYGLAALEGECQAIRTAPDGSKHHTVNKAAYAIGGLVTAGELIEGSAFAELSAALGFILPYCEDKRAAQNTLRTAFQQGMGRPRDVPEHIAPASELTPDERAQITARCGPLLARLAQKHAETVRQHAEVAARPVPVSADIMEPGGVLQMIMDECKRTAIRAQPFLWLGAAIAAVGALAGRRYESPSSLRTNIYIAAVADSGSGKDHAPSVVRRALCAAGLERFVGGEDIASGSGLLQSLSGHPARIFILDELGMFLKSVTGKNAAAHKAEIWEYFIKIYSRAKERYFGKEYGNRDGKNERADIWYPHPVVYGMTTPSTFWSSLEGGAMHDGGLARFLLFLSDQDLPPRNKRPGNSETPEALIIALQNIAHGPGEPPVRGGNLPAIHLPPMSAKVKSDVYSVPMTEEAEDLHDQHMTKDQDAWSIRRKGTQDGPIISRLGENAIKLALIRAISTNAAAPVIGAVEIEWGWQLALHCTRTMLKEAGRFIADSDYERKLNKALDIIQRHGPITEYEMLRRGFKALGKESERRELLHTLTTANLVTAVTQTGGPTSGRPTVKYVASQNPDGEG